MLLQDCKLIDENSRKSPAYSDPMYAPFYYHFGKFVCPKRVVTVGFTLGLLERCFFESCKSAEEFLAIRVPSDDVYYSPRMGLYNVRRSFKRKTEFISGGVKDDAVHASLASGKWGAVFLLDETRYDDCLYALETVWGHMEQGGCLVVENVEDLRAVKQAFHAFADSVGRRPEVYATRYGTGVLYR